MGKFGGFYKGEKKKAKKDNKKHSGGSMSTAPTFTLPELISRKKNTQ